MAWLGRAALRALCASLPIVVVFAVDFVGAVLAVALAIFVAVFALLEACPLPLGFRPVSALMALVGLVLPGAVLLLAHSPEPNASLSAARLLALLRPGWTAATLYVGLATARSARGFASLALTAFAILAAAAAAAEFVSPAGDAGSAAIAGGVGAILVVSGFALADACIGHGVRAGSGTRWSEILRASRSLARWAGILWPAVGLAERYLVWCADRVEEQERSRRSPLSKSELAFGVGTCVGLLTAGGLHALARKVS